MDPNPASLLCRVRDVLCALPLAHVGETMRPLAVEPIAGAPAFVRGVSVVRGRATPVVDAAFLICGEPSAPSRFVTLLPGDRAVMLAVDEVVGLASLPDGLAPFPSLIQNERVAAVAATGALDGALLVVLDATRVVPAEVWATLPREGGRP
jgi:purine-binding chemotaxis protein CheW